MQIDDVDGEVAQRGVAEEFVHPDGAVGGVGDGGRGEADAPCGKGLDVALVGGDGARDGHAGGAVDAEVWLVEGHDGVSAVVGDGVVDVGFPDGSEGGVVIEEKGVEGHVWVLGWWIGSAVVALAVVGQGVVVVCPGYLRGRGVEVKR